LRARCEGGLQVADCRGIWDWIFQPRQASSSRHALTENAASACIALRKIEMTMGQKLWYPGGE